MIQDIYLILLWKCYKIVSGSNFEPLFLSIMIQPRISILDSNSMIELVITKDGSHTLYNPELGVWHHSVHGAIQESRHIFIELGLMKIAETKKQINIFEMGFGTGLNVLLTALEALKNNFRIDYTTIEAFPLKKEEFEVLNYDTLLNTDLLQPIHLYPWNQKSVLQEEFWLTKVKEDLLNYQFSQKIDLVYFDAYAPTAQPELWSEEIFRKIYNAMNLGGILTTYCSKSVVRKALQAAGFKVEKHPGPPFKREVLRAIK